MTRRYGRDGHTMDDVGVKLQTASKLHVQRLEVWIVDFGLDVSLKQLAT